MKISSKIVKVFGGGLLLALVIGSCNKPDIVKSSKEGAIYMPVAASSNSKLALLLADTAQVVPFGAAYGGLNYPAKDIAVSFKIDSTLISTYNALHGTSYIMLPAFSYIIPTLSAVIKAGQTGSNTLPINIITKNLNQGGKYILPITIASVSSGSIDSNLHTTYFTIDTIERLQKDITSLARLAVSIENGGGSGANEGSPKLVDGDYNSKFLFSFNPSFWAQLQFPTAQIIGAYTITSGNDSPDRDAVNWNLTGSNDGTTWTTLDTKAGMVFPGRNQTIRYEFINHTGYTYYRLNITKNNGSDAVQISEWRLITYP